MARPQKQARQKRDQFLRVRLTPDEHSAVVARAAQAGMPLSDYVRHMLIHGRVRIVQSSPVLSMEAILALNRLGVNLNQLARIGNATGELPSRLPSLLERINALLDEAMALKRSGETDGGDQAALAGE